MPRIAAAISFVKLAMLGLCTMLTTEMMSQPLALATQQLERSFVVEDAKQARHVTAHIYVPDKLADDARILVVMHGVRRGAQEYLNDWKHIADVRGLVLMVPEFSKEDWPNNRHYSLGNIVTSGRESLKPKTAWSFSAMEKAVEITSQLTGVNGRRFFLYGHSAGGQFVHRYVMVTGGARVIRAVAANAGWYMWPDDTVAFPYGSGQLQSRRLDWHSIFGTELVVLLGADDTDPAAEHLLRTPQAMAQGHNRLQRGRNFFAAARAYARERGHAFRWRLATVAGVGHSNRDMCREAARAMFAR